LNAKKLKYNNKTSRFERCKTACFVIIAAKYLLLFVTFDTTDIIAIRKINIFSQKAEHFSIPLV